MTKTNYKWLIGSIIVPIVIALFFGDKSNFKQTSGRDSLSASRDQFIVGGDLKINKKDVEPSLVEDLEVFLNRSNTPDGALVHKLFPILKNGGTSSMEDIKWKVYIIYFNKELQVGRRAIQPYIDSFYEGIEPGESKRSINLEFYPESENGEAVAIIFYTTYTDPEDKKSKVEVEKFKYVIGQDGVVNLIDEEFNGLGADRLKNVFKDNTYLLSQLQ